MKFRILGADRETGEDVEIIVEARDEAAAETLAGRRNIMVSDVALVRLESPRAEQSAPMASKASLKCVECGNEVSSGAVTCPYCEALMSAEASRVVSAETSRVVEALGQLMQSPRRSSRTVDAARIEGFWCETPLKLSSRVLTPLGGRVTVINVCVDIHFSVAAGTIVLHRVTLSRGGGGIGSSNMPINIAAQRRGEAWFASTIVPESALMETVERDLSLAESRLRRIMLGKWRAQNRPALVRSLVNGLNQHASPEELESLIATAGRGNDIIFTYTKPTGVPKTRRVCVHGVKGLCIRATDRRDETVKSFRIDRITNARNAN